MADFDREAYYRQKYGAPAILAPVDPRAAYYQQQFGFSNIQEPPIREPERAQGMLDAIQAGFQASTTGLVARQRRPGIALGEDTTRAERLASLLGQTAGDLPTLLIGAAAGTAAGTVGGPPGMVVGAGAGAMGLTEGVRAWLLEQYAQGAQRRDLADRLATTLVATGKGAIIGGATAGIGAKVGAVTQVLRPVTRGAAIGASELGTMVTVSKALEGGLPSADDFIDGAIVLGGLKGALVTAAKLRTIYTRTGVKPEQIVEDARQDSRVAQQLLDDFVPIPEKYRHLPTGDQVQLPSKAEALERRPLADLPGEPSPIHINHRYIDGPEALNQTAARVSEIYELEIQTQRRGSVPWHQSIAEAETWLADALGRHALERTPGQAISPAEILTRRDIAAGAADEILTRAAEHQKSPTPESRLELLAAVERAGIVQAEFLGARAEAGRALNVLKSSATESKRAEAIKKVTDEFGGERSVDQLAEMLLELPTAKQALRATRDASTIEKFLEAWKAGLVSGPETMLVNLASNLVFAGTRIPTGLVAATLGKLHGGEKVTYGETVGTVIGMGMGSWNGIRQAYAVLRHGTQDLGKAEQRGPAIKGVKGEIIRLPFRALEAGDAMFRAINETGTAYGLAMRQAASEKLNFGSSAFNRRVAELVDKPTKKMTEEIQASGRRYTFTEELGPAGQALQTLLTEVPALKFAIPFVRTPANIFKETGKFVPGVNFLIRQVRDDFRKGGAARDKVIGDMTVGGGVMAGAWMMVDAGIITGGGSPNPEERASALAAGWRPYSIHFNGEYYSYRRFEPIATLLGATADAHTALGYMSKNEADKASKMLWYAFSQQVTNKTFLQGIVKLMGALADPYSRGERFSEGLAGSIIPGLISQIGGKIDDYQREVSGILDAIKARIPIIREGLLPKRDIFGEPVRNDEQFLMFSSVRISRDTTDPVRREAARLGVGLGQIPKTLGAIRILKNSGIELTDVQRDYFHSEAGQIAYELIAQQISQPGWDTMHPLLQRATMERAFHLARKKAAFETVPPEQRAKVLQQLAAELQ